MEFLLSNGESVPVHIKRRKGARHMRLSLNHSNEAVVSVPWRCSDREALRFLEKQRDWLEAQLARVPRARTLGDWLVEYPQLSGSGDRFTVRVEATDRLRADYIFAAGINLQHEAKNKKLNAELKNVISYFVNQINKFDKVVFFY